MNAPLSPSQPPSQPLPEPTPKPSPQTLSLPLSPPLSQPATQPPTRSLEPQPSTDAAPPGGTDPAERSAFSITLRPLGLGDSLLAWDQRAGTLAIFGFVLLVLEMLWGRASLIIFAVSFDGMPDFKGSLLALLNPENLPFIVAYLVVGGLFAGLIFSVSVVSIPMILDRSTDAISAVLTSLRLVLSQPAVMLCWGALITATVVLAMLPWFAGLLVAGPVLGHASWHAYRAAVGD